MQRITPGVSHLRNSTKQASELRSRSGTLPRGGETLGAARRLFLSIAPRSAKADRLPRGVRKVAEPHFLESIPGPWRHPAFATKRRCWGGGQHEAAWLNAMPPSQPSPRGGRCRSRWHRSVLLLMSIPSPCRHPAFAKKRRCSLPRWGRAGVGVSMRRPVSTRYPPSQPSPRGGRSRSRWHHPGFVSCEAEIASRIAACERGEAKPIPAEDVFEEARHLTQ